MIQFWVDKYNLLRRYSTNVIFNYDVSLLVFKIFQMMVIVFVIGKLLFIYYTRPDTGYSVINIITAVIALGYTVFVWVLPKNVEESLFESLYLETESFSDCLKRKCFVKNYWRANEATGCAIE